MKTQLIISFTDCGISHEDIIIDNPPFIPNEGDDVAFCNPLMANEKIDELDEIMGREGKTVRVWFRRFTFGKDKLKVYVFLNLD